MNSAIDTINLLFLSHTIKNHEGLVTLIFSIISLPNVAAIAALEVATDNSDYSRFVHMCRTAASLALRLEQEDLLFNHTWAKAREGDSIQHIEKALMETTVANAFVEIGAARIDDSRGKSGLRSSNLRLNKEETPC